MSHFTVTVKITKARLDRHDGSVDAALEEMLAPYDENNEACKTFEDHTDEVAKEYDESREMVCMPDGSLKYKHECNVGDFLDRKFQLPVGARLEMVPFRQRYATLAEFTTEYHGYEEHDGRFGHMTNKQGHWDWYSIGGRWTGFYPLKSGRAPHLGQPGAFDNQPKDGRGGAMFDRDLVDYLYEREVLR